MCLKLMENCKFKWLNTLSLSLILIAVSINASVSELNNAHVPNSDWILYHQVMKIVESGKWKPYSQVTEVSWLNTAH